MSLVTLGIWVAGVFALIVAGIALLPNGADHPLPPEIASAMINLYHWLYSLNNILPVDTLIKVVGIAVLLEIFTRIVYPLVFTFIKWMSGSGQ